MSCLIAKPNTNMPNCHENDFCYCDMKKKDKEIQKLKEKLMKARDIIHRSTPCDVDDSGNHVDGCQRCAFLRAVRG